MKPSIRILGVEKTTNKQQIAHNLNDVGDFHFVARDFCLEYMLQYIWRRSLMKFLNWLAKYRKIILVSCVIMSIFSAVILFNEEKPVEIQYTPDTSYYTTSNTNYNTIIVYVTVTGTKYHRKYCRYVDGKNNLTEMNEEIAILKGYERCSVCF